MKCSEAKNQILLQDTGEQAKKQIEALLSHLRKCDECRQFQEQLPLIRKNFQPLEEPPVAVLNEIKREARRLAPEGKQAKTLYWKPALAMAASVLIGLGIFLGNVHPNRVGLELVLTETELLAPADQAIDIMYGGLSDDDLAFNFLMTYEEESEG